MAFGTLRTREADSLRTVADAPALALLDTLRDVLARQGVRESVSSEQEGYYFVIEGGGEVSLQYHDVDRTGSPSGAASLRRHQAGLLKCSVELVQHGYAVTLVMSPRTLALHIRSE